MARKKAEKAKNAGNRADLKSFRTLPSFRLHVLADLYGRFADAHYRRDFGLKLIECRVFGIVGGFGEVSFKRLCQEGDIEKSYASRIVNGLCEGGYIEKAENTADQRSIMLSLTKRGREMHHALHADTVALNERWLSVLSEEQRKVFRICLVPLIERVVEMERQDKAGELISSSTGEGPPDQVLAGKVATAVALDAKTARQIYEMLGMVLGEKD